MSLSFHLIEEQRRAALRHARYRQAQRALLGLAACGLLLALAALLFGFIFYGFFYL